jgi:glycosyltransferase involved in cell wall biosynthesis
MKISVIITAFNAEKFISKAIESVLEQDYADKELIIIDDISTDKTHEIIASYQDKFPKIIRWIKERDYGISHARNLALKHVTGDIVGFLGADDFLHKDFFKELPYYAKQNPNFDVMYFNSYCVGNTAGFCSSASTSITVRNLIKSCPIGSGESFYYRKEIFDHFQFNEKNRYSMDYELNMAIAAARKFIFYPVNIVAVFNLDRGDNISSANKLKQRLETIAVQMKYAKTMVDQLRIVWRSKKLIFKNRNNFHQISRSI